MRVGAPGTGMWSWNVITWPHYLATVGDIADGFTFSRVTDMMDFFDREGHGDYYSDGAPSIDFRYWAEKLSGGRSQEVREYSDKIFIQHVKDHLEEDEDLGTEAQDEYEKIVNVSKQVCERHGVDYEEWLTELRKSNHAATYLEINEDDAEEIEFFGMPIPERSPAERSAEILEEAHRYADNEVEAHDWLRENQETFGQDAYWDWSMKDFTVHFLFACWAVELTVRLWRQYEASPEAEAHRNPGDGYVLVEGGLVQNNPALPVFDLDVLDSDVHDEETAHEVLDLYERINAHPAARIERTNILVGAAKFVARYGSAADKAAVATLETSRLAEKPAAPRPIE
jgi:hypothetical protein